MGALNELTSAGRRFGKSLLGLRKRLPGACSTWALALFTFGVGFLPVFSRPGYESALLMGLLVPSVTALCVARGASLAGTAERTLMRGLRLAGTHALAISLVLSLHALRVGWCDPTRDLVLLALGPVAGIVMAGFWGSCVSIARGAVPSKSLRRTRWTMFALCAPLMTITVSVVHFYASPVVFAFDPFVGFFAGSPYDTGFDPSVRLLSYRAGSFGLWLLLWSMSRHVTIVADGRLRLRCFVEWNEAWRPRLMGDVEPLVLTLAILGLGLFGAVTSFGEELGHRSSTSHIRQSLGRTFISGRCEIVHGPGQKQRQVRRLADDCDAWLTRLERRLGQAGIGHVTAYVFDGAQQKEMLMGAANTQIAKPWRREIYLNTANYPDDVVGHELAHVVAGLVGQGPFHIAGSLGGWLPNPGLIEGLAVALAPDEDGDLTELEWSAALLRIGKLPRVPQLFSLDFLGHSGPLAYTVAGAFVEWLGQHHGKRAVRAWYSGRHIDVATGQTLAELERRFIARLSEVALPDGALDAARARFARLGVYSRRCPHAVDRALSEAEQLLSVGDADSACRLFDAARRLDPTEIRARFGLGECAERGSETDQFDRATRAYAAIFDDANLPSVIRQRALEKQADLFLRKGRSELARPIYERLLTETFDAERHRSLEIRLHAKNPVEIDAVRELFLGRDGEPSWDVAVQELLRWSEANPSDGVADYLLGRNFWQRGQESIAVEHLDTALQRGIDIPIVHAEASRLRTIAACALGDRGRAVAGADQLLGEPALRTPRRVGLLRVVERCAGRLVGDDWPEAAIPGPSVAASLTVPAAVAPVVAKPSPAGEFDGDGFGCPDGMLPIRGGSFWVGSNSGTASPDERPRFQTRVRGFCLDRTEVTVEKYAHCVASGHCRAALGHSSSCNARHGDRAAHPVNCVDQLQATTYCAERHQRLPTEIEWEYAARGGSRSLTYPWGEGSPDGRACWKQPTSCRVASYAAGAFGLYDMSGNVWEW
ncbi:MAG TPA: SUMF1/EgtB/PvdO family nonheme iron enzyme, partial [Polyangiaceae bacterium]